MSYPVCGQVLLPPFSLGGQVLKEEFAPFKADTILEGLFQGSKQDVTKVVSLGKKCVGGGGGDMTPFHNYIV